MAEIDETEVIRKLYRGRVFFITFLGYGLVHCCRKAYTQFKVELVGQRGCDVSILGLADGFFMFFYALGSFYAENLADIYHGPTIVGLSLLGTSMCLVVLAVGAMWLPQSINMPGLQAAFVFIWIVHGLMQSAAGPVSTSVMGNWFGPTRRRTFTLWTFHQYFGNILALLLAALVLTCSHDNWVFILLIPALSCFAFVWIVFGSLPAQPSDLSSAKKSANDFENETGIEFKPEFIRLHSASNLGGTGENRGTLGITDSAKPAGMGSLQEIRSQSSADSTLTMNEGNWEQMPVITIWEACAIPNTLSYVAAFGLFKLISYVLFFWLPFILTKHFNPRDAALLSIMYDIGMMPGGMVVNLLGDLLSGRPACAIAVFMICLVPILCSLSLHLVELSASFMVILLILMGLLVGGPNSTITAVVAADLADQPSIRGNARALGTVTGIISGGGSLIAACGLGTVGWVLLHFGSAAVLQLLAGSATLGTILLCRRISKELRPIHTPLSSSFSARDYESIGIRQSSELT